MKVNSVNFIADGVKETDDLFQIPTIVTMEGVQNGGHKPFGEIIKSAIWLNGKPFIPDGHPQIDGHFVTVTSPRQASGFMSDPTPIEGFDVDGVKKNVLMSTTNLFKSDPRNEPIIKSIQRGDTPAVSVGFFGIDISEEGEFEGQKYEVIETDIYYDHLARELDGACSVEDGCGMGVNGLKANCGECDEKDSCACERNKAESENTHTTLLKNLKNIKGMASQTIKAMTRGGNENHIAKQNEQKASEKNRQGVEKVDEKEAAELKERTDKLAQEKEDLQGKVSEFDERLKEMEANEESAQKKLDAIKAEEEKATVKENAKLIEEITEANGKEAEEYKDWNTDQLKALKEAVMQSTKKADKLVLDPKTGETGTNGLLAKTQGRRTVWADSKELKEAS